MMDDRELQQWVERISLSSFGRPFLHHASFNGRLRATGGRYFTKSHNIEISSKHMEAHGRLEMDKIIKHELCHYHLHLMRKGYKHRDHDFKQLLRHVGGARYCKPLPDAKKRTSPYRYRLICASCKQEYLRKRKVDPKRYVCGVCRGKLSLIPMEPTLD